MPLPERYEQQKTKREKGNARRRCDANASRFPRSDREHRAATAAAVEAFPSPFANIFTRCMSFRTFPVPRLRRCREVIETQGRILNPAVGGEKSRFASAPTCTARGDGWQASSSSKADLRGSPPSRPVVAGRPRSPGRWLASFEQAAPWSPRSRGLREATCRAGVRAEFGVCSAGASRCGASPPPQRHRRWRRRGEETALPAGTHAYTRPASSRGVPRPPLRSNR